MIETIKLIIFLKSQSYPQFTYSSQKPEFLSLLILLSSISLFLLDIFLHLAIAPQWSRRSSTQPWREPSLLRRSGSSWDVELLRSLSQILQQRSGENQLLHCTPMKQSLPPFLWSEVIVLLEESQISSSVSRSQLKLCIFYFEKIWRPPLRSFTLQTPTNIKDNEMSINIFEN